MKRFILLSVFALLCGFLTAGLSDSSVTKETPTYQASVDIQSVDAEFTYFEVSAPVGEYPEVPFIQLSNELADGVVSDINQPPRYRCQKSERITYTIIYQESPANYS